MKSLFLIAALLSLSLGSVMLKSCGGNNPPPVTHSVPLNWTASRLPVGARPVIEYIIFRRVHGTTAWLQIGTTTKLTFTDNAVTANVTYDYEVKAENTAGISDPSNIITVTVP